MAEAAALSKFACPSCGGEAVWNPAKQKLICPFCGTESPAKFDGVTGGIVEHDLVAALRAWNGQMEIRGSAPFLVALASAHVRAALAENAAPGAAAQYNYPMSYAVVEMLLRERPAGWFGHLFIAQRRE